MKIAWSHGETPLTTRSGPHAVMKAWVENHVPLPLMSKGERMKKLTDIDKEGIRGENVHIDEEDIRVENVDIEE